MTNKKESLHPSLTVTNIKNHIPIQLELETGLYSTWSQLFKTHCKAYRVLDHIIPSSIDAAGSLTPLMEDKEEWEYVDAHVLTWLYGSISRTLLSIISKADTAQKAWDALQDLFQDKKKTRAVYLEDQFTHVELSQFADVNAYCLHLKSLADQLDNVGAPVSGQRLVLQLIKGLSTTYDEMVTVLEQQDPLPTFHQARLKLILHEKRRNHQAACESSVDATAAAQHSNDEPEFSLSPKSDGNTKAGFSRGNNRKYQGNTGSKKKGNNNGKEREGDGRLVCFHSKSFSIIGRICIVCNMKDLLLSIPYAPFPSLPN